MREWTKPELTKLGIENTKGGGLGGPSDGVMYQSEQGKVIGTSGPDLDYPVIEG